MVQLAENQTLWSRIKGDLQSLFPHDVYRTWFENLEVIQEEEDKVTIGVPSEFAAIWIQDNYHDLILKRMQMATGRSIQLAYQVVSSNNGPSEKIAVNASVSPQVGLPKFKKKKAPQEYILNPRNTFENFVIGPSNQLAHAACLAVSNAPARAYNPLFLYGDTGLGKTHLMHAVAHAILKNKPDAKVAYISTEKFTNEFISAIQSNTLVKFRQRYRNVDILLIDDIHFLSGKERIQEEFFHTFNDLFEAQKQIFLCSDRPAAEIAKLESRLVSRFQWGLVTDIQVPDFETRIAILTKKAQAMKLDLSSEIIAYLAEKVSRNVRRLEGALTRVASYANLVKGALDIPTIENLLKDILQEEAHNKLTIEKIQQKVTGYFRLKPSDMHSKRRPANIAFPRQIAMFLCRTLTDSSLQDIGEAFGGRDHGTVIHACKSVQNMIEQDESVKRNVEYLKTQLCGGAS